jgi:hypothetical protein
MSTSTSIFIVVLCFSIGMALGALLSRRKAVPAAPKAEEKEPSSDETVHALAPAEPPAPISPAGPGDQAVLRIWRTPEEKLWLEMDGQRLEAKSALAPAQARLLLKTVMDLRPWLDIPAEPAVRREPPAVPPAQAVVPAAVPAEPAVKPVSVIGALLSINKPPQTEQKKEAPVMKSMLEQIDEVLQLKLATSIYREREIHLMDGPGGTVVVKEGVKSYEGIGAVPDPELQALIRLAVSEWEKGSR